MTNRAEKLLREAAQELKLADGQQRKADDHKWAAAERMWIANKEEGVTQREIAVAVGVSQSSVHDYVSIWSDYDRNQVSFTEAYYGVRSDATPEATEGRAIERVLRERPEVIAEKIKTAPEKSQKIVEQASYESSIARHERKRRAADEKFREEVGGEVADGLELTELAHKQKGMLVDARSELRGFNRFTTPELIEYAGDTWTEQCLDWLAEIESETKMARALLAGEVTDDALAAFLSDEGR